MEAVIMWDEILVLNLMVGVSYNLFSSKVLFYITFASFKNKTEENEAHVYNLIYEEKVDF